MNINVFTGTGRLTRDVELRYTAAGKACCKFGIAINGRKDDEPLFLNVVTWEKLADTCVRLKKGEPVAVTGSLRANRWQGQDGQKRENIELTARDVEFLDRGAARQAEQPDSPAATKSGPTFRTTRISAPGATAQGTLPRAGGMPLEDEKDPF